jgi:hypothetical protein
LIWRGAKPVLTVLPARAAMNARYCSRLMLPSDMLRLLGWFRWQARS